MNCFAVRRSCISSDHQKNKMEQSPLRFAKEKPFSSLILWQTKYVFQSIQSSAYGLCPRNDNANDQLRSFASSLNKVLVRASVEATVAWPLEDLLAAWPGGEVKVWMKIRPSKYRCFHNYKSWFECSFLLYKQHL
jgi:hypothetical protein